MSEDLNKKNKYSLTVKIQLFLFNILSWPLVLLPRHLLLSLGGLGGHLLFRFWKKRSAVAVGNIEMIKAIGTLPADLPVITVARESFANMGRNVMEALVFYHRGLKPFYKYCRLEEGREHLEEALAKNEVSENPLLLTTGHIGNWEILCHFLAKTFNFKAAIVGRNTGNAVVDAIIENLRTKEGTLFISKRGGAREMMKILKNGYGLGTLIDQAVLGNHPGAPLPFLGKVATTNLGPLRLARRAKAQVLMVLFRREGLYHYIKIMPILQPSNLEDREEGLKSEALQLNDWLSEHIRKYPSEWMWGHRRWKSKAGIKQNPDSLV